MIRNKNMQGAFALGVLSVLIQTAFLRELFAVYGFSELLLAMLLFFWFLWGAIGSFTHRSSDFEIPITIFAIIGIAIPLLVRASGIPLRPFFGMTTPFWNILIAGFFCSFPTFFGGRTFAALSKKYSAGKLYAAEGFGALIGGVISMLVLQILNPAWMLTLLFASVSFIFLRKKPRRFIIAVISGLAILIASRQLISFVDSILWQGFTTREFESAYGRIALLERHGENYIYENGRLVATSADTLSAEQIIHPITWAHPMPGRILLIGGAFSGAIRDIQKHEVDEIVIPFPNRPLLKIGLSTLSALRNSIAQGNVILIDNEAKDVMLCDSAFDIICLMPGFPSCGADNRFWTIEFFNIAKSALDTNGIFAAALPVGANMLSECQNELVASIWITFRNVFPDAEIYFLDGVVLIASAKHGRLGLRKKMFSGQLRDIDAATVPRGYLPILFQLQREQTLIRQLASADLAKINSDWRPLAYLWGILEQAQLGGIRISPAFLNMPNTIALIGMTIAIIVFMISKRLGQKLSFILVLIGGFWGMLSQSLFLLLLQASFGNLYWLIGIAVGIFLFGSAIGSLAGESLKYARTRIILAADIFILLAIVLLGTSGCSIPMWLFFILFALSGAISGISFGTASAIGKMGNIIYALDLVGASLGAIFALFLIPTVSPIAIVAFVSITVLIFHLILTVFGRCN